MTFVTGIDDETKQAYLGGNKAAIALFSRGDMHES
jgi:hypothetical protein